MDTFDVDKAISVMRPEDLEGCFRKTKRNEGLKEAERFGVVARV